MKKKTLFIMLMMLFSISIFGRDYSVITKLEEEIRPDGSNGNIRVEIEGETNRDGVLFLPYEDSVILNNLEILKGSLLTKELARVEVGTLEFIGLQFAQKDAEVKLVANLTDEEFYKGGKSKQKNSYPSKITTVSYSIKNSTPTNIENYSVKIFIPKDIELYKMLTPSKTSDFKLGNEEGMHYVVVESGKIQSQSKLSVKFDTYVRSGKTEIITLFIILFVTGFFMYKRRSEWK